MTLNTNAQTNCNQCLLDASNNCLCIYSAKQNYNRTSILFFVNFLMDVTHCNIRLPMGKFWMLPMITSARESVKTVGKDNIILLIPFNFIFQTSEVSAGICFFLFLLSVLQFDFICNYCNPMHNDWVCVVHGDLGCRLL